MQNYIKEYLKFIIHKILVFIFFSFSFLFLEITILAIGESREKLADFVENDQTDIFPSSMKTIQDIKQRINKS